MKLHLINIAILAIVMFTIVSCTSSTSEKRSTADSGEMRTAADTALIPGTPGPSGTQPRPSDTTIAHRDSLKQLKDISDSSYKSKVKPN